MVKDLIEKGMRNTFIHSLLAKTSLDDTYIVDKIIQDIVQNDLKMQQVDIQHRLL